MKASVKIILLTTGLLATGGVVYALTRKKSNPVKAATKKVVKVIFPETIKTDDTGSTSLKQGSSGQYVEWLQETLNGLHNAAIYINKNCGGTWPVLSSGMPLTVSGTLDAKTAKAMQFYFQTSDMDIDDMLGYRDQVDQYTKNSNKCKYPLTY